jgi:hypothetical protein
MKRLLAITVLCVGALALSGCTSFVYEDYHYHSRPRVVYSPPARVIEEVPAYPSRHHRPSRDRHHRY